MTRESRCWWTVGGTAAGRASPSIDDVLHPPRTPSHGPWPSQARRILSPLHATGKAAWPVWIRQALSCENVLVCDSALPNEDTTTIGRSPVAQMPVCHAAFVFSTFIYFLSSASSLVARGSWLVACRSLLPLHPYSSLILGEFFDGRQWSVRRRVPDCRPRVNRLGEMANTFYFHWQPGRPVGTLQFAPGRRLNFAVICRRILPVRGGFCAGDGNVATRRRLVACRGRVDGQSARQTETIEVRRSYSSTDYLTDGLLRYCRPNPNAPTRPH